uniref:Acyl-CoA_dh_1 domain-containing protein n=1 Tax=Globodera pallida TaxID=36090 RepID=A0A183BSY4_GLOPA
MEIHKLFGQWVVFSQDKVKFRECLRTNSLTAVAGVFFAVFNSCSWIKDKQLRHVDEQKCIGMVGRQLYDEGKQTALQGRLAVQRATIGLALARQTKTGGAKRLDGVVEGKYAPNLVGEMAELCYSLNLFYKEKKSKAL